MIVGSVYVRSRHGDFISNKGLREFMEELVESLKKKDYDHVATMINREFAPEGIVVSAKDFE